MNVVEYRFDDNQPQAIYTATAIFLLNNRYSTESPVQGNANPISCYPGVCNKFNFGEFGFGCRALPNKQGNYCSKCAPGFYLPKRRLTRHAWPVFLGRTHLGQAWPLVNLVLRADIRRQSIDPPVICVLQESLATFLSLALMYHAGRILLIAFLRMGMGAPLPHCALTDIIATAPPYAPSDAHRGAQRSSLDRHFAVSALWVRLELMVHANFVRGNSGTFKPGSTHCHRCPVGKFINAQKTFCALERRHGSAPTIQYVLSDGPQRLVVGWDAVTLTDTTSKALAFLSSINLRTSLCLAHCQLLSHHQSVH